jgi:hypothetical protein
MWTLGLAVALLDGAWTVQGQMGPTAVVMTGPVRSPLGEPFSIRVVVTGPPETQVEEPRFVSAVGEGTLVGMTSFGPDPTGPFVSRGWVLLIQPQERGGLSLPTVEVKSAAGAGEPQQLQLAIPTIEVIDPATSQWESVSHFFIWAGIAGAIAFVIGGAMTLARSNKSELSG